MRLSEGKQPHLWTFSDMAMRRPRLASSVNGGGILHPDWEAPALRGHPAPGGAAGRRVRVSHADAARRFHAGRAAGHDEAAPGMNRRASTLLLSSRFI